MIRTLPLPLLERLPYSPRKPHNLPKIGEARSMTTAAGFHCSEGVVLCSDTQMTQDYSKYPQSKYRTFYGLDTQPVFIFSTNNLGFTEAVILRLADRIARSGLGRPMLLAVGEEVRQIGKESPKESKDHELLLTIRARGPNTPPKLWHITGSVFSPVHRYKIIGDYTIAIGLATELYNPIWDMERMAFIAACMLAEAKEYGGFSGGDSEILLAWDKGFYEFFPQSPNPNVRLFKTAREIEELYFDLKRFFHKVLLDYCDSHVTQPMFAGWLRTISDDIAERRKSLIIEVANRLPPDVDGPDESEEPKDLT